MDYLTWIEEIKFEVSNETGVMGNWMESKLKMHTKELLCWLWENVGWCLL